MTQFLYKTLKTTIETFCAGMLTTSVFFFPLILGLVGFFGDGVTSTAERLPDVSTQARLVSVQPVGVVRGSDQGEEDVEKKASSGSDDKGSEKASSTPKKGSSAKKAGVGARKSSVTKRPKSVGQATHVQQELRPREAPAWHQERMAKRSESKQAPKGTRCDAVQVNGLSQIGTRRYEVERSVLESYANLSSLQSMARVGRHRTSAGHIDGFWIGEFRCESVLYQAGLRHGDVISAVNGRSVETVPQALRAYRSVKRNDVIKLDVLRKGKRLRVTYIVT